MLPDEKDLDAPVDDDACDGAAPVRGRCRLAEEPVTFDSENLTWKQNKEPVTFSLFFNMNWSPVDVWGTDAVSQQVTADTGVSFDVIMAQDNNHLANIISTGDYPDAVFVYGTSNLQMMEDPGHFLCLERPD